MKFQAKQKNKRHPAIAGHRNTGLAVLFILYLQDDKFKVRPGASVRWQGFTPRVLQASLAGVLVVQMQA
ncbi:MAG: hypothetical protein HYZ65_11660 [Burkholderiales bacterium]|nr:hypothetical protein [Burkholderiales bacterium]